ncbi:MAG: hypothetical protein ACK48X_11355, partial [Planctomycetota bacterium]
MPGFPELNKLKHKQQTATNRDMIFSKAASASSLSDEGYPGKMRRVGFQAEPTDPARGHLNSPG